MKLSISAKIFCKILLAIFYLPGVAAGESILHPGGEYSLGNGANHIWMRPNDAGAFATDASPYSGYGIMMSYLVKPEGGVWKGSGSGAASMLELIEGSLTYSNASVTKDSDPIWNHRFVVTRSGNVGIGATDPTTKLDVRNGRVSIKSPYDGAYLRFRYGGYDTFSEIGMTQWPQSSGLWIGSNLNSLSDGHITKANQSNSSHPSWYAFLNSNADNFQVNRIAPGGGSNATTFFHISGAGNVGIGTITPSDRLHVAGGNIRHPGSSYSLGNGANHIWMRPNDAGTFATGASPYSGYGTMMSYLVKPEGGVWKGSGSGTASMLELIEGSLTYSNASVTKDSDPNWNHRFVVTRSGEVGIGTANPQSMLAVNGIISAKEVKVTEIGWSDFVFEDTYELPSLNSLESYIKKNKHLPEIPSAKEVKEQGLAVSDMLAKQMQKIEEMTLYLIQLKQENDLLKERVAVLERSNKVTEN